MKKKFWTKANILFFVITPIIVILDLVTKYAIVGSNAEGTTTSFIPGVINFVVVFNDGAAWGLFAGFQIVLIIVTILFLLVFLWFFFTKKYENKLFAVCAALLTGGALGNLFDRIVFGYVRDFIHLEFMSFPVFNIADAALTIGVVLMFVYLVICIIKDEKLAKQKKMSAKTDIAEKEQKNQEKISENNQKNLENDEKMIKNDEKNSRK